MRENYDPNLCTNIIPQDMYIILSVFLSPFVDPYSELCTVLHLNIYHLIKARIIIDVKFSEVSL